VSKFPNGHYLPYACDRSLHSRYAEHEKKYDVSLIGSVRADREQLKDKLAEHGVDLELIGGVFREEYIDALAASRITVNQNPDQGAGLLNMRFWEAQAAGSLVFTENRDFKANVEAGLKNVTAIAYEDSEDLAHSCSTLLKCEYLQETMVSAGQERIFGYHTYESRCKSILETVFQ
jgi:spore maturation protein CgeB